MSEYLRGALFGETATFWPILGSKVHLFSKYMLFRSDSGDKRTKCNLWIFWKLIQTNRPYRIILWSFWTKQNYWAFFLRRKCFKTPKDFKIISRPAIFFRPKCSKFDSSPIHLLPRSIKGSARSALPLPFLVINIALCEKRWNTCWYFSAKVHERLYEPLPGLESDGVFSTLHIPFATDSGSPNSCWSYEVTSPLLTPPVFLAQSNMRERDSPRKGPVNLFFARKKKVLTSQEDVMGKSSQIDLDSARKKTSIKMNGWHPRNAKRARKK